MKRIWNSRKAENCSYCPPLPSGGSLYTLWDYSGDQEQLVHTLLAGGECRELDLATGESRKFR